MSTIRLRQACASTPATTKTAERAVGTDDHVAELACATHGTDVRTTAKDQAGPDPGAHPHAHHIPVDQLLAIQLPTLGARH
jgi:hypothetical protein